MPPTTQTPGDVPAIAPESPSGETVRVPVSAIAGAQPGSEVSFTVVSIDGDMATLSPATEKETEMAENPEPSTIARAAGVFGEGE